jgi:hypothetical protein
MITIVRIDVPWHNVVTLEGVKNLDNPTGPVLPTHVRVVMSNEGLMNLEEAKALRDALNEVLR